jgi:hypothetical protein
VLVVSAGCAGCKQYAPVDVHLRDGATRQPAPGVQVQLYVKRAKSQGNDDMTATRGRTDSTGTVHFSSAEVDDYLTLDVWLPDGERRHCYGIPHPLLSGDLGWRRYPRPQPDHSIEGLPLPYEVWLESPSQARNVR